MYDRYGSYEHAKNAFLSVLDYDPSFDKANEIYFRLGIIYKEQGDFGKSLEVFKGNNYLGYMYVNIIIIKINILYNIYY